MDTAVGLVRAYLELSGYFVLAELPVRTVKGRRASDVTDVDILAVRFPHQPVALPRRVRRPLEVFLGADPALGCADDRVDVIIGEMKEGRARLNPALQREQTIAFALRRVGCCPEPQVAAEARAVAHHGSQQMSMPGRVPCRIRLVAFAGYEDVSATRVATIPLAHCAEFIAQRLHEAEDVLGGVQFKDPTLGLLALQEKLKRHGDGARNDAAARSQS